MTTESTPNSKLDKFDTIHEVMVVDAEGQLTGEVRTLASPAIDYFFPDEPAMFVNWLFEKERSYRPTVAELQKPVVFEGEQFFGCWAWGSAVKRGYTIGLVRDLVAETLGKKAEDGLRAGRWLFSNSWYGAGTGELKVKVVEPGQLFNGLPVEDGFGYIARSVAEMVSNGRDKIVLGAARDSFHFWQRVPWTNDVEAESLPLIREAITAMSTPDNWAFHNSSAMEDKRKLVALEKRMIEHPFVANAMARTAKEMAIRLATTVPTDSITRIAVPTTAISLALNGPVVVARHPIDAWGSMMAFDVKDDVDDEFDRIARMEVVQYTLASPEMFAKGCMGVVDDLGGYDLVLCSEDVKMGKCKGQLEGAYLGFTMHWAAGSAIGINAKLFKLMGGDHDGDGIQITDCANRPALWRAVKSFPRQDTIKLVKSKSPLNKRAEMILRSMTSIVGFATNVMASTFSVKDRLFLAQRLGYTDEAAMDRQLNFFIKVGTDGFKTAVDMEKTAKQCAILQSNISRLLGKAAPWTSWRADDWAFQHGIPAFINGQGDPNDPAVRCGIPLPLNGTIAEICKVTLGDIGNFLTTPISARPLMEFRHWAPTVDDELYEAAAKLQVAFNGRVTTVNFSDPERVREFKVWWESKVKAWMGFEGLNNETAAAALWRVAHSSRSTYSGASSVFYAFPEECKLFIEKKPGLSSTVKTIVLGLRDWVESLTTLCQVVEYEEAKNGKRLIRKALVLDEKGAMLGAMASIPVDVEAPEKGQYLATILRRSGRSWQAKLVAC